MKTSERSSNGRNNLAPYNLDETDMMTRIVSQQAASLIVTSQRHPRRKSHYPSHSPTESVESRLRWARRESWLLGAVHQRRPPTFLLTIQRETPVSPGTLKAFEKKLSRSLGEHSKRFDFELRYYAIKEIDARNLVHSHVLVRTELELKMLRSLFDERCQTLSGSQAIVTYCEPIRKTSAVSCYVTKDLRSVRAGEKELRLFPPGFVRLRSQLRYFEPWPVPDLRNEGRELWLRDIRQLQFKRGTQVITIDGFTSTLFDRSAMLTTHVTEIRTPNDCGD